ncbi:neurexin-4 isoform X2 [Dermatophagoides pteronyssinus]|uniref:neurexin-4 isoform X2 n=1 Tax=Dermatophagoides pteronyssinus TaxID=6956 RepID=UPI003F67FE3E
MMALFNQFYCKYQTTVINRSNTARNQHYLLSSSYLFNLIILIIICITTSIIDASDHCNNELIHSNFDERGIRITSSSDISKDKSAYSAILHGQSAWSAAHNDLSQYIEIDLGRQYNISAIGTQGRQNTLEFIQEFKLESGIDGHDYNIYRDRNGNIKLFQGNTDGNSVVINRFDPPIIAQFVRINPTRWRDRISMRIQLYGCDYHAISLNFDGNSYIKMNLDIRPISSSFDDVFRFRFRTNEAFGNILYGTGIQGDLMALQLIENKLVLTLDLGENIVDSISAGSLLDDNLWHDVFISRQGRELTFSVDRVVVKYRLKTEFNRLDLNNDLYIGGLPGYLTGFINTRKNFTGCIENLSFNTTNIAHEIQDDYNNKNFVYKIFGNIHYTCQFQPVIPITFNTRESHINVLGNMNNVLNASLDFRTFNDYGLLLYHQFSIKGFFAIFLKDGKLTLKIQGVDPTTGEETPQVPLEPFDRKLNDGSWHNVQIALQRNRIILTLDGIPSTTIRTFQMQTGQKYTIGGGIQSYRGFIGCMRWIYIENRFINPELIGSENIHKVQESDITIKSCQMIDRCHPNPCEHGGTCKQNHLGFVCDCGDSGYLGAVCHVPRHPFSCTAFMNDNPNTKREDIKIDVDGSGPLEPFWVTCLQTAENTIETVIHHQNEASQKVQGFLQPGSYIQDIKYDAPLEQIVHLVNRSDNCRQKLKYECRNARLLNSPSQKQSFSPHTWWVSRDNQKMDYWAGGLPGTQKCKCGLYGNCFDPKKWCNCDSSSNQELMDEGEITQLEYLPVRQIRVGDTGLSSQLNDRYGRFTLGSLICDGDRLFHDIVTFRYSDATIEIPLTQNFEQASDIYLQFKTTTEYGVLFHATGPEDFIKLAIVNDKTIQFSYSSGTGLQQVSVEAPFRLNDNQWHSILVEKNKKEARLVVDSRYTNENRENADNSFPLYLTSYFIIGATTEYREGYLGCMRALVINGEPVELRKYARGNWGIYEGCVGKCESSPCLNNGTCIEEYNGYSCDCQWTAFKGPICADEIGVSLRSDYYIRYDFETTISTMEEYIRVGFTTTEHRGLIYGISSYTGEYLNLLMSSSGHLRLVFDFGFERQEIIIKEENFALGQHHDITIRRADKGSKVIIWVDNYEPKYYTYKISDKAEAQFNRLKSIYIGRNETMDSGEGFIGCISRVIFDDHFPLRRLYQENKRSNVRAFPSDAEIFEDKCGIEPPTHPPDVHEARPPPTLRPGDKIPGGFSQGSTSAIIGGFLAALVVLLILFCFASSRFIARQKGEYVTHEDQGADSALDPDTAVVKGTTGPDVSVKREYFI